MPIAVTSLLKDPPPALAFEICEAGVTVAQVAAKPRGEPAMQFQPLKPGTLAVSPLHDNVLMPEDLAAAVRALVPANGSRKRRDAALVLPDFSTRTALLDFDEFPSDPKERLSLIRFRMKKSVPFDIEAAAISYTAQPAGNKKFDVVAVVAPLEIVARYEAPFRAAGLNPGLVTISSLSALSLIDSPIDRRDPMVLAKISGRVLTVIVLVGGTLKLARCLELTELSLEEISADLYPTFVYIEDNLGAKAARLLLCGFSGIMETARLQFERELGLPVEPLRSPWGAPGEHNAGLIGYLQSVARS